MTKIYTATYGIVEESTLISKTPLGYRVKAGRLNTEMLVFIFKQFSGWVFQDDKIFYQQMACTSKKDAEIFALAQILAMEYRYKEKLKELSKLKSALIK